MHLVGWILVLALESVPVGGTVATWWQHGDKPYPLEVPATLSTTARPIWHQSTKSVLEVPASPQFVLARGEFTLLPMQIRSAVVFVTAQQSPLCQPDPRLADNDYGSCIPHGGSSQSKLLGGYKLHINGRVVATGPGRRVNQTQGVDAVDVEAVLKIGTNAVGVQGYHTANFPDDKPRILVQVVVVYNDSSTTVASTGADWHTMDADLLFNPVGSTGAWAGGSCTGQQCSGMPQEWIDMNYYPTGWAEPGFIAGPNWLPAVVAPPFVLPLRNRPARPVAVFAREAASVKPFSANGCSGCYLIDYGREFQGGLNISFSRAKGGEQVTVQLSEEIGPSGKPLVPMRTGNNFTFVWTLAPGMQTVMQHEYVEIRYALIVNSPEVLTVSSAMAWVIRYPLSDNEIDNYGDAPTVPPSFHRRPAAIANFSSGNATLDAVWQLVRHTLVACGGLDVNVDSNTRQRDFCATDAFITGIGQLAISNDYGMPAMTAANGFQVDSNIWQGMTDFRSALISLAYNHALYTGDLSLIKQRYEDIKKHSFVHYFHPELGLVLKTKAFMGSSACKCPESWSPAGMPPGVYEALDCTCTDLNDWPPQYQDGYVIGNVSTVANSYIALAAAKVAQMAKWLGKDDEAEYYQSVSDTILVQLRQQLFNAAEGNFADGLDGATVDELKPISHQSMQATLFPMMAGVVNETALPGMGLKMVHFLKATGMKCSCMAAFWLLEGLYKTAVHHAEAADHALDVMTSKGVFSWHNMLSLGATCTMETWPDGTTPGSGPDQTWSHPWCAGPNSIIIRFLLGVQPMELGWSRISFSPQPSSLTDVNGTVPILVRGVPAHIKISLAQTETVIQATIGVPLGTAARVCLPPAHGIVAADAQVVSLDGQVLAKENVETNGRMLCLKEDVGSGSHVVSRQCRLG